MTTTRDEGLTAEQAAAEIMADWDELDATERDRIRSIIRRVLPPPVADYAAEAERIVAEWIAGRFTLNVTLPQRADLSTAIASLAQRAHAAGAEQARGLIGELLSDLRRSWSFDNGQQHTHTWHSREDFIERWTARLDAHLGQQETGAKPDA